MEVGAGGFAGLRKFPGVWAEPQLGAVEGASSQVEAGCCDFLAPDGGSALSPEMPVRLCRGRVGSHVCERCGRRCPLGFHMPRCPSGHTPSAHTSSPGGRGAGQWCGKMRRVGVQTAHDGANAGTLHPRPFGGPSGFGGRGCTCSGDPLNPTPRSLARKSQ